MSPFEYVIILLSIILGLGIARLVTGLSGIIQQGEQCKVYWPHLFWVGFVFFLHLQEWWVTFELRDKEVWYMPGFMRIIFYPIVLFILAQLLFPPRRIKADYKKFYFENYKKLFQWVIVLNVLTIIDNYVNQYPIDFYLFPSIMMICLYLLIIYRVKNEILHKLLAVILLSILTMVLIFYEFALGETAST